MTQKDVDRVLLALYAVREVGERGNLDQMKAICYCLRNRVRTGWGEWMEVIQAADNFGAHLTTGPAAIDPNNRIYQRLLRDVDDIYFGHSDSPSTEEGGSLESSLCDPQHLCCYWCFVDRPVDPEFARTIVRDPENHPHRATMGNIMFYE
jgi:hypothetical protein